MKVKVHNDGKEKSQSFQAWYPQLESIVERGYGASEDEAIKDHFRHIESMIDFLNDNMRMPTEKEYVDWKGDPIGRFVK